MRTLFGQLVTIQSFHPEWNRLKRVLSNTRKKNAADSHKALEAELDAMEAAMLPGGKGLTGHLVSRDREVIRETVAKELGLGKSDMAKLTDDAVDGLGMMSEVELTALKGKLLKKLRLKERKRKSEEKVIL